MTYLTRPELLNHTIDLLQNCKNEDMFEEAIALMKRHHLTADEMNAHIRERKYISQVWQYRDLD
jgi:DNA recombination-dependent growth factor C